MMKRVNQEDSDDELFEKKIKAALFRIHCPDAELLLDYQWKLLSDEKTAVIHQHVQTCQYCTAELTQLPDPPLSSALAPAKQATYPEQIRTLFARFVGHYALTRSPQQAFRRGRIMSSFGYDIEELNWHLNVQWGVEPNNIFLIQGLLLGPQHETYAAVKIELIGNIDVKNNRKSITAVTRPDSIGSFVFEDVPAGIYSLMLYTPAGTIPIPDITLKMPDE